MHNMKKLGEKTVRFHVPIAADDYDAFKALCQRRGVVTAEGVRRLIKAEVASAEDRTTELTS